MRRALPFVAVVLAVVALDQVTKFVTLKELTTAFAGSESPVSVFIGSGPDLALDGFHYRPLAPRVISADFFQLRYAENPGAAFGLFSTVSAQWRGPLFHFVSIAAVLLIAFYASKLTGDPSERWAKWGLPLVMGGALGNYLDRLIRGYVIDFLEVHWFEKAYWPAFNIADSAIVVGVALLLIDTFVRPAARTPGVA